MLTRIDPGMLADSAIRINNFSAIGDATAGNYLRGDNSWSPLVLTNKIDFGPIYFDLATMKGIGDTFYAITQIDFGTVSRPAAIRIDFNNA